MAITEYNIAWPVHAFAAVQEFHALKEKRERTGALAIDEAEHLLKLREIFEPKRITGSSLRRQPVKVPVQWAAVVLGPQDGRQEGEVVRLSLRELEVALQRSLPIGAGVRLIVAGPGPREWVRCRAHRRDEPLLEPRNGSDPVGELLEARGRRAQHFPMSCFPTDRVKTNS